MEILNTINREYYNEVTNSGVICPTCKKAIGSVEYVKIFKIKFYPAISGFALGEHEFAQKYSKRFQKELGV